MRTFLFCVSLLLALDTYAKLHLTSVRDIILRPQSEDDHGWTFDCTCQVMNVRCEQPRCVNLIDKNYPHTINFYDLSEGPFRCQSGDLVRARGFLKKDVPSMKRETLWGDAVCITNVEFLGAQALPETTGVSALDVNLGKQDAFIHVDGVLSSVVRDTTNAEWNWLILRTPTGKVRAGVPDHDYPYDSLVPLIDAEVRLRGFSLPFSTWRAFLGQHILLYGKDGILILRPAASPLSSPPLSTHTITHRQQVKGRVRGLASERIFILTEQCQFLPVTPIDCPQGLSVGDLVSVIGFADLAPMGLQLTGAIVRKESSQPSPPVRPQAIEAERMFSSTDKKDVIDSTLYGKLVELDGTITSSFDNIPTDKKFLLKCGKRTIVVDVGHLMGQLPQGLDRDCAVRVAGLCFPDFGTDVTNMVFPAFNGFILIPRMPSDVIVIRRPPWWTPIRLACVIAVLTVFIVIILIWNRMLRVLSERRGRELAEEQILSAKADLKVEERTRLAIELHDSISQTLTGIALQIDAAAKTSASNPSAAEKFLTTARTMLASCRQELRCCIWDLKSRSFDEKDMTEAVQKTLAPHIGSADLKTRFNVSRSLLSDSAAHDTLRIIRELAVNALRHGQARHLRVAGEYRDGFVRFSVCDDGTGFDPTDVPGPAEGHFGLQGIRERIKDRNGDLHVESAIGKGAKITVTLMADKEGEDEK